MYQKYIIKQILIEMFNQTLKKSLLQPKKNPSTKNLIYQSYIKIPPLKRLKMPKVLFF